MTDRIHILISGKVQGVFFRDSAFKKARELGIRGWVKNLEDGQVEIFAEGNKEALDKLVEWCHKGSILSRVDKVEPTFSRGEEQFGAFKIEQDQSY